MRKLHVGTSPLTNRIYAGYVLKDGITWGEGKQNVTGPVATQFVNTFWQTGAGNGDVQRESKVRNHSTRTLTKETT